MANISYKKLTTFTIIGWFLAILFLILIILAVSGVFNTKDGDDIDDIEEHLTKKYYDRDQRDISRLTTHNIECDGGASALSSFQLKKDSNDNFWYAFNCVGNPFAKKSIDTKYTNNTSLNNVDVTSLTNHEINCGTKSYLAKLKMTAKGSGDNAEYRYEYGCKPTENGMTLLCGEEKKTEAKLLNSNKSYGSLTDHVIKCDKGSYLNYLKFQSAGDGKYQYVYKCCR